MGGCCEGAGVSGCGPDEPRSTAGCWFGLIAMRPELVPGGLPDACAPLLGGLDETEGLGAGRGIAWDFGGADSEPAPGFAEGAADGRAALIALEEMPDVRASGGDGAPLGLAGEAGDAGTDGEAPGAPG